MSTGPSRLPPGSSTETLRGDRAEFWLQARRPVLLAAIAACAIWGACLGLLAVFAANPPVVSGPQLRTSDAVVIGRWRGGDVFTAEEIVAGTLKPGDVTVLRLESIFREREKSGRTPRSDERLLLPLQRVGDVYRITILDRPSVPGTPRGSQTGSPLLYPADPALIDAAKRALRAG